MLWILAPHNDDELIGCFSILAQEDIKKLFDNYISVDRVLYIDKSDKIRKKESEKCSEIFTFNPVFLDVGYDHCMLTQLIEEQFQDDQPNIILTPDPLDQHPLHKITTKTVELLQQKYEFDIIYYSTDMNTQYLQELPETNRKDKLRWLNEIYSSQKELWSHDWKYFLFESYHMIPLRIRKVNIQEGDKRYT